MGAHRPGTQGRALCEVGRVADLSRARVSEHRLPLKPGSLAGCTITTVGLQRYLVRRGFPMTTLGTPNSTFEPDG